MYGLVQVCANHNARTRHLTQKIEILSERGRTNEILVIIIFGISIGLQRAGQFITMLP
jgi:hypothetical protein